MSHFFYTDAHLRLYSAILKRRATNEVTRKLLLWMKP